MRACLLASAWLLILVCSGPVGCDKPSSTTLPVVDSSDVQGDQTEDRTPVPVAQCPGDDSLSVSREVIPFSDFGEIEYDKQYRYLVLCDGKSDWFKWGAENNIGDQHVIVSDEQLKPGDCLRAIVRTDYRGGVKSPRYTEQLSATTLAFTFELSATDFEYETRYYLELFKSAGCVGGSRIAANYRLLVKPACSNNSDCQWSTARPWCRSDSGTCNPCEGETTNGCENSSDGLYCLRRKFRSFCGCDTDSHCPVGQTCQINEGFSYGKCV